MSFSIKLTGKKAIAAGVAVGTVFGLAAYGVIRILKGQ